MSVLPRSILVPSLAWIAWSIGLAGCGPPEIGAGRAPLQEAGSGGQQAKAPIAERATTGEKTIATVKIDQFAFEPVSLTIAAGTTVDWTNRDDVPHTVVEKQVRFKSQALDTDDHFRHTFSVPGTYQYFCSIHPHMVGEIHVKP